MKETMFLLEIPDYIAAYDAAVAGGLDEAQMGLTETVGAELVKTSGEVSPVIARLLARGEQDMALALYEVAFPESPPQYGPFANSRMVSGTILVP